MPSDLTSDGICYGHRIYNIDSRANGGGSGT